MEFLGSDYRGFPGCLPDLGIICALQDFLQTHTMCLEEPDPRGEKVNLDIWDVLEKWFPTFLRDIVTHEEPNWISMGSFC